MIIDLRSDTVTKPSKEMHQAMFAAEVGDDVFDDDPTVIELENLAAKMFGMEAALFCPSGIMCNQVAIKLQTKPGDKVLCDELSHIYYHEKESPAFLAGAVHHLVNGNRGRLNAKMVNDILLKEKNISLVSVENTVNKGGGCFYTLNELSEISEASHKNKVNIHLDGARIFNALVETGDDSHDVGKYFDTISFCLSKGLGAPVGSMLLSSKENIEKARATRNKFGGGMRQAGYLAAAGIYALNHNIQRLKEDHKRAKKIGEGLSGLSFIDELFPVDTNIVIFRLPEKIKTKDFLIKLSAKNIRAVPFGNHTLRMVTHLDFTDDMLQELIKVLRSKTFF